MQWRQHRLLGHAPVDAGIGYGRRFIYQPRPSLTTSPIVQLLGQHPRVFSAFLNGPYPMISKPGKTLHLLTGTRRIFHF
ncbi:hypothetical protein D1872_217070 [compost metagenome]